MTMAVSMAVAVAVAVPVAVTVIVIAIRVGGSRGGSGGAVLILAGDGNVSSRDGTLCVRTNRNEQPCKHGLEY